MSFLLLAQRSDGGQNASQGVAVFYRRVRQIFSGGLYAGKNQPVAYVDVGVQQNRKKLLLPGRRKLVNIGNVNGIPVVRKRRIIVVANKSPALVI